MRPRGDLAICNVCMERWTALLAFWAKGRDGFGMWEHSYVTICESRHNQHCLV
jgi:hypothetical protein